MFTAKSHASTLNVSREGRFIHVIDNWPCRLSVRSKWA